MNSISEIWANSKGTFDSKSLPQILAFAGDGKLKDNNKTSNEFRELLEHVPSNLIEQFANNCLTESFQDSGFALQDIINQIGTRLNFTVENGLYRGKQNEIGFDGIWKSTEGHSLVLEIKTTDAYRINLDTIAEYRKKLIETNRISKVQSSILIIVGREDSGDLEAQIRGSQHAWDIRLISVEALLKLLSLKESLNDAKTIQQINELLKPREYTRIDKLIDLIFVTTKDMQLVEYADDEIDEIDEHPAERKNKKFSTEKVTPVNFHDECLTRISAKLNIIFIKQTRISFSSRDKKIGLICSISKPYKQGQHEGFWFSFHPYQKEFFKNFNIAYIAFGCGSPDILFLIPYNEFEPFLKNCGTTKKEDKIYWQHVRIHKHGEKYLLAQSQIEKIDITKYKI